MRGDELNPTMIYHRASPRILLMGLIIFLLGACSVIKYDSTPIPTETIITPTPPTRADLQVPGLVMLADSKLTRPVLPENPTQADKGLAVYHQICLACHGDWGQGLTDEWRATWGPEEMNCWQSKCHAPNHPEGGFELLHYAPPVLGVGSLSPYKTAADLHEKISLTMPWWNPGSLTEEQAWSVTAFLLRERGELPENLTLDESNASMVRLHEPLATAQETNHWPKVLVSGAFLVVLIIVWGKRSRTGLIKTHE